MIYEIRKSFTKDANLLPAAIQNQIAFTIENIDQAKNIHEITDCKKLKGYKTAFRIKIGAYRIGFFLVRNSIELVRVLHRKEIYRNFP